MFIYIIITIIINTFMVPFEKSNLVSFDSLIIKLLLN